ncbi:aldo/keto reductase [Mycolicibacterium sp. jd]|uniref:aldo/keto reductase n=1 Tax=unclassified Mycolicibacterium TaxID=2636767 RepID=UPI00351AC1E3
MTGTETLPAHAAGTVSIGSRRVHRLGYGAMRLAGDRVFGPPPDHGAAIAVLRRAVELGVDFIDTADVYGPWISEELIREALHPYRHVVIATKGGMLRFGSAPGQWRPCGRPDFLREQVEGSLRRLGVERIDLYQLHRADPTVPLEDSIGGLSELVDAGKIGEIGLSEVNVAQLEVAGCVAQIATVQNLYNVANRGWDDVVDYCTARGIAFIPWGPVASGRLAEQGRTSLEVAADGDHTPAQLALAWLLHRSPMMLPIPGTRSITHLQENIAAAEIALTEHDFAALDGGERGDPHGGL